MSETVVTITPVRPQDVPADATPVTAEAVYVRKAPPPSSDGAAGDLPNTIFDTARVELDTEFRGALTLEDVQQHSQVELRFLSGTGATRLSKTVDANGNSLDVQLAAAELTTLAEPDPRPPAVTPNVDRAAQLVPVGETVVPFATSTLHVAPLTLANAGWKKLGLDGLFHVPDPATMSIEGSVEQLPALGALSWTATHVDVDGRFTATLPQDTKAWIWWLSGQLSALGTVVDDLSQLQTGPLTLPLPPFSTPADDGATAGAFIAGRLRADVSETELANNPQIYTEDPGSFCRPFENPERILGERGFQVIMRAEQPEISAEASVGTRSITALDFEPVAAPPEAAPQPAAASTRRAAARRGNPNGGANSSAAMRIRDVAAFGTTLVRHTLPSAYVDILQHLDRGRTVLDAKHPVQWEDNANRYQATTMARGHILDLRLRWRSNGYSLGTVANTLTLAPRQAKRIQKIDWQRIERTRREERTQLVDEVADQVTRERDYDDAVQANLSEWSRGESESSVTAEAGGAGFAMAGFVIGGGAANSNASSSSSQEGGRRTAASEEQRLRDSIRRFAEATRKFESTVVTEVTQEEEVTGTTEVVRNANYAHSLTVIYYQILRHLKLETAFAGVRECLFVPFSINPFTVARAYRWRELLRRGLRDPRYAPALRWLRDVVTGFVDSDIPPGRRSDQPIRSMFGSITLTLAVERPHDQADDAYDEAAWNILGPFLGTPARSIFEQLLQRAKADRDRVFQEQHAPRIASGWVDTLQLDAGGQPLDADFTLATRYLFNGAVRVDFTVAVGEGQQLTRENLAQLRIRATRDLTPGSVANLTGLTFTYQTDYFRRTVRVSEGAEDLVTVETGVRDPQGAILSAVPDDWERRNERAEVTRAVNDLVQHLNENVEYYHKVIWWNMDRDRLFMLIDGFYVPGTNGISAASVVERDPIAIVGNAIVFRVSPGSFLGIDDIKTPEELYNYYASHQIPSDPLYVSLPTDGLYAQTVMDQCGALEEHFGNTDWALSQPEPDLGTIAPELLQTRATQPEGTTPTPLPQTIINLQNAPEAPAPSGLAGVLGAVQNANAFRDMAGLAGTQANARAGLETAAGLATTFGQQAAALKLAEMAAKQQATQSADQKLSSIRRAKDQQLVTPDEAQKQAAKVLEEMNSPSTIARPHQDPTLAQAVRAATGMPGSEIEATTADGQLRVSLASAAVPAATQPGAGAGAPAPAPAPPDRIDGLDCNAPNAIPSWADLRADGIQFAILKASEGQTYQDPQYRTRHDSARAEQFLVGSYHYGRASGALGGAPNLLQQQADNMIGVMRRLLPGDLPPSYDFEEAHNTAAVPWRGAQWQAPMEAFLDRVETALGRTPMIYTSRRIWHEYIQDDPAFARFGDYPLWVVNWFGPDGNPGARYNNRMTRQPNLPAPWSDWAVWQYSGDETPPQYANLYAANKAMDVDMSKGGIHVLRGLADLGRPAPHGAGVRFIAYADEAGVIKVLTNIGFWLETNLSDQLSSGAGGGSHPAAAGDVAACEVGNSQYVAFRERADGHLYEIERGANGYSLSDLTAAAGAAPASDPQYLVDGNDRYIVYWGTDDHQYLLDRTTGAWQSADLTAGAGMADASGNAFGFVANGNLHVVARAGHDGHLLEATRAGGAWQSSDLTAAGGAGTPAATYQPSVYIDGNGARHVVYRALRGAIHEIDGNGADVDLSQSAGGAPTCAGNPAAFVFNGNAHVVYRRVDGQIHEIFWDGDAWKHAQLPCAEPAAADPAALVGTDAAAAAAFVVFRGQDAVFREVKLDATGWTCGAVEPVDNPPPVDDGVMV